MGPFIVQNVILLACLSIIISIVFMFVVRRLLGLEYLRTHHEVSDPLLACVGTLFAILLGFMVANSMTRFEEARVNVEREAGSVSDVFRLSLGLPEETGNEIRTGCLQYVDDVIDTEWQQMEKRGMSTSAWDEYGELWQMCLNYEPESDRQSNIHASLLSSMTNLGDCRRVRATQMSYQLPPVLWTVVLIGALATATLVLFFGIQNTIIQIFTNALVTLVLFLNVFLLACFDDPFEGEVKIKPHAFEVARSSFEQVMEHRRK